MPKLKPEKPDAVVKKWRKLGFDGSYGGGKHVFMRHPQTRMKTSVPIHRGWDGNSKGDPSPVRYLSGRMEQVINIGVASHRRETPGGFFIAAADSNCSARVIASLPWRGASSVGGRNVPPSP